MKFKKAYILNSIFICAALLNLVNLKLYEISIIRLEVILCLYASGLIIFLFFRKSKLGNWGNFSKMIFYLCVVGSISTVALLGINYLTSDKNTSSTSFEIIEKAEITGSKYFRSNTIPTAVIEIKKGFTKKISFKRTQRTDLYKSKEISLLLSKGIFNIDIIHEKKIK